MGNRTVDRWADARSRGVGRQTPRSDCAPTPGSPSTHAAPLYAVPWRLRLRVGAPPRPSPRATIRRPASHRISRVRDGSFGRGVRRYREVERDRPSHHRSGVERHRSAHPGNPPRASGRGSRLFSGAVLEPRLVELQCGPNLPRDSLFRWTSSWRADDAPWLQPRKWLPALFCESLTALLYMCSMSFYKSSSSQGAEPYLDLTAIT
jgi:hypothetical protein